MSRSAEEQAFEVFSRACDLAPADRRALLDELCKGDAALRAMVESLLAHDAAPAKLELAVARAGASLVDQTQTTIESPVIPARLGRYRIIRQIGAGGMGTVYEAEQDNPNRRVALKVLRGIATNSAVRRFQREVRLVGRLQHEGIAQVFDAGMLDSQVGPVPYYSMELIDGAPLTEFAERERLDLRAKLELMARVCDAVQYAHQHGVIHRDLKPANVLVSDEATRGRNNDRGTSVASSLRRSVATPKILDFGIAKAIETDTEGATVLTETGGIIGTPAYMSPEQLRAETTVDVRVDVYGLGVMLFETLSGQLPFDIRNRSIPEAIQIVGNSSPARLSVLMPALRGEVETIVAKALEADRDRRYASAAELAADVRRYLNNEPILARPATVMYRLRKFAGRHRGLVFGVTLALCVLVLGSIATTIAAISAMRSAAEARHSEAMTRRTSYQLSLTAADGTGTLDPRAALELLNRAPGEFRGWEWRHLVRRYDARLLDRGQRGTGATSLARTADGTILAAFQEQGRFRVAELTTGRVVAELAEAYVNPVLSEDGSRVAVWDKQRNKVVILEVTTGRTLTEIPTGGTAPAAIVLSPRGDLVALNTASKGVSIWDVATGAPRALPTITDAFTFPVTFSVDGATVALSTKQATLCVVDLATGELRRRGFASSWESVAISHDGGSIALGRPKVIDVCDARTLESVASLAGSTDRRIAALSFSADDRLLLSVGNSQLVRLWDWKNDIVERTCAVDQAESLMLAGDVTTFATGGSGIATMWTSDVVSCRVLRGHDTFVYAASFSPDGTRLVSADLKGGLRWWNARTGELLNTANAGGDVRYTAFTRDGTRVIDSARSIYDAATGKRIEQATSGVDRDVLDAASLSPDAWHLLYARLTRGGSKLVRAPFGQSLASSFAGDRLIECDAHGEIIIKDTASARELQRLNAVNARLISVAMSPDGRRIVAGDDDGKLHIWDRSKPAEIHLRTAHVGPIHTIAFTPDGSRFASGGDDNLIWICDADSGDPLLPLRGHQSYVHSLEFSPDGCKLVSASGDGTVRIWDAIPQVPNGPQSR